MSRICQTIPRATSALTEVTAIARWTSTILRTALQVSCNSLGPFACETKKTRTTSSVRPGTVYSVLPAPGDRMSSSLNIHSPRSPRAGLASMVSVLLIDGQALNIRDGTKRRSNLLHGLGCLGLSKWQHPFLRRLGLSLRCNDGTDCDRKNGFAYHRRTFLSSRELRSRQPHRR